MGEGFSSMPIEKSKDGELERLLGLGSKEDSCETSHNNGQPSATKGNEPSPNPELEEILEGGRDDYKVVGFEDPVEMLYFIEDNIRLGKTKLHDWQIEELVFLSKDTWDFEDRLKFCLTAANGSGKDAYILAPFAVWQISEKIRSRFIGTSKSSHQLNTQTCPYIRQLCMRYGSKLISQGFHPKPFVYHTKPFHIACAFTGGEILAFVTDEAENIEGYHPWPDYPKAPLTIAINEAKGVPDEYFDGFSRCTYSRWIEITSPGRKTGRNWEHYDSSIKYPDSREVGRFYSRKITSFDCPHKSRRVIEEDKIQFGGEDSELYKSKHLAEYTTIGEQILVDFNIIDKYLQTPCLYDNDTQEAAGLDLSLGGDETVLVIRRGNKTKSIDCTRIRDATLLVSYLDKLFSSRALVKGVTSIYTDVGGLGKPIFDSLLKLGWKCIPVLNNQPAIGFDKNLYGNRGTEIYFEVCAWFNKGYIIPPLNPKDKIWREQLGSRKYIRPDNDKLKMQPKAQFKKDADKKALANSKEWESPDRADAWVLAFTNWEPRAIRDERQAKVEKNGNLKRVSQKQLVEAMNNQKFAGYQQSEGLVFNPSSRSQRAIISEQLKMAYPPKN